MSSTNKDTKVVTGKVRLSYCHIVTPRANEAGEEKYSCNILLPKTDKTTYSKIKKAIEAAKTAGETKLKVNGKMPMNIKTTVHDGDGEMPNGGEYGPECKGHWVINTSSKTKPGIIDKQLNPILDSSEIYSGMYARVSVNFFAYNTGGNRGIACGLNNVQKVADGDYLGGRSRAEDDFDEYEDESDDLLG